MDDVKTLIGLLDPQVPVDLSLLPTAVEVTGKIKGWKSMFQRVFDAAQEHVFLNMRPSMRSENFNMFTGSYFVLAQVLRPDCVLDPYRRLSKAERGYLLSPGELMPSRVKAWGLRYIYMALKAVTMKLQSAFQAEQARVLAEQKAALEAQKAAQKAAREAEKRSLTTRPVDGR